MEEPLASNNEKLQRTLLACIQSPAFGQPLAESPSLKKKKKKREKLRNCK